MSQSTTFDTHQYFKKLKDAGCDEKLAEVQAEAIKELIENNLATKRDLKDMEKNLIIKIGGMISAAVGILGILITILSKLH